MYAEDTGDHVPMLPYVRFERRQIPTPLVVGHDRASVQ